MEYLKLIAQRYSTRAYLSDPVEDEKLECVLDAARLAPTAHNNQPFRFLVLQPKGREEELKRIYDRKWFVQAPLVICAVGVIDEGWVRGDGQNYYQVDTAIAMDHLILAATDQGLGTCWIAHFDAAAAKEILGLPDGVELVAMTPLGYPADQIKPKTRKKLEELVRYERW
jgi:nitroreductase